VENEVYRITVAGRGAITSLIDKTRGNRQFARTIDGRAINDLGPSAGTLQVENAGPVSVTLVATAAEPLNHTTRITLYRDSTRIDIRNDIHQDFSDTHTWSYAFNLDDPEVWHEEVGAVIRAKLASQGGRYSDRNARYDWLTLNHFADMTGQGAGVTLSNADTAFMRLGRSTVKELDTATPQISPLVGGQVDGPKLGIPRQGGDTHFLQRFALQTHGHYDAASAMRFALEHQNPLVAAPVSGGSAYPEDAFSALSCSNPDVLLWALKPAEEGIAQGLIARVWNLSARPANFTITTWRPLARAERTTHIETNLESVRLRNGALSAVAAPQQFQTYRLLPAGRK
jgi:alpha-mannosidase